MLDLSFRITIFSSTLSSRSYHAKHYIELLTNERPTHQMLMHSLLATLLCSVFIGVGAFAVCHAGVLRTSWIWAAR